MKEGVPVKGGTGDENATFTNVSYLLHIFHKDNWMLAWIIKEKFLKIRRTRRQDYFVALQHLVFARQRYVDEMFRS